MKIKNTSKFNTEWIRRVIHFVRPSGISKFDVMMKDSNCIFAGRAYYEGSGYHSTADPFIVVRASKNKTKYPYMIAHEQGSGYLPVKIYSDEEKVVLVMAHELRHLWQHKQKNRRGYVWGSRGKYSERDCDAYAIHCVRRYRREF